MCLNSWSAGIARAVARASARKAASLAVAFGPKTFVSDSVVLASGARCCHCGCAFSVVRASPWQKMCRTSDRRSVVADAMVWTGVSCLHLGECLCPLLSIPMGWPFYPWSVLEVGGEPRFVWDESGEMCEWGGWRGVR